MTRAPIVRLATDADGEAVRHLVEKQHGMADYLKWDRIAPYWLVAELDGEIIGALQTCPSRPVGRLEMLSTARHLSPSVRVLTVKALAMTGMGVILGHGAQQVSMFVAEDEDEFRKFLLTREAEIFDTGNILAKRLV